MSHPQFKVRFFGGADEVTGSRHLLFWDQGSLLLDCGLFQGHRHESIEKNRQFPFDIKKLSGVILSHAHIDHSGALPLLVKKGYRGPIHCTKSTADLCRIMLMDSAHLQVEDAKFFNKIHRDEGKTIEPLYEPVDVEETVKLFVAHDYEDPFVVTDDVRVRFLNAGHVLGSAMVEVEMLTPKGHRRLLFTGDLGRREALIMTPPLIPPHVDYLMIESTYGARAHPPLTDVGDVMAGYIRRAFEEGGRILIPSFALERTQEMVYVLEKLRKENRIPPIHMYVDSPMAVDITELFNRSMDSPSLSPRFKQYVKDNGDPFGFNAVRYVRTVDESKRLNELPGAKIILSASGMCEGGRILHHLRNNINLDNTIVLLVGYQSEGTLGRRLAEGAKRVKIFGLEHEVRASVYQLHHFSSHADKNDLMWFMKGLAPRPQNIFLIHGETEQRVLLSESLKSEGFTRVEVPKSGEIFELP